MNNQPKYKCFHIKVQPLEVYPFNHEEQMEELTQIPGTEVLANKHITDGLHEYLIYSDVRRRVSFYSKRIAFSEVEPYRIDSGVNNKTKVVSTWLYK